MTRKTSSKPTPKKSPSEQKKVSSKSSIVSPLPLTRKVQKGPLRSSSSAKQLQYANNIFVMRLSLGIVTAYAKKPNNSQGAYTIPFTKKLKNDSDYQEGLGVFGVFPRRVPGPGNQAMKMSSTSGWDFEQYVRIFETEEQNSHVNVEAWGRELTKSLNSLAKTEAFKYPLTFRFAGEITPTPRPKLDTIFCDTDIITILRGIYDIEEYSDDDLADCEELMKLCFTDMQHGRNVILHRDDNTAEEDNEEEEEHKE